MKRPMEPKRRLGWSFNMALLTSEGRKRITQAIKEAEKTTGGEIVTAIIPEK